MSSLLILVFSDGFYAFIHYNCGMNKIDKTITTGHFIFLEGFKQICECFYSLFGIRIAFFTTGGEEINPDEGLPCCEYCRIVREELGLKPLCVKSDRDRCLEVTAGGEPLEYVCHSGLSEYIVPLRYEGGVFGNMMIGQFRTSLRPDVSILSAAKAKGIEAAAIEKAFAEVPFVDGVRLSHIEGLLGMLTELITLRRMITNPQRRIIEDIMAFMERNPEKNLSLSEAADISGCSVSTFSAMFKQQTNISFKQYQLTQKLNAAETYLKTRPDMSIKEISERLGFGDQYHFSKIYKKHRGGSPSRQKAEGRRQKG